MPKEITKQITEEHTITISEYDSNRCSRDCYYCHKVDGNYKCYLNRGGPYDYQEIEGFDGFEDVYDLDEKFDTADTYGFKRTEDFLKKFGV